MKCSVCVLLTIVTCSGFGYSGERGEFQDTSIIGHLSTGEATVKKASPRPVKTHTILRTTRHQLRGRSVTMHEVATPLASPSVKKEEAPLIQKIPSNHRPPGKNNDPTAYEPMRTIGVSATIYGRGKNKRTYLRIWEGGHRYECLSNINFHHMSGFSAFRANGREYFYLLGHGDARDRKGKLMSLADAETKGYPVNHRHLRSNRPSFVILGGDKETSSLAHEIFHDLHTLYRVEKNRLTQAHAQRVVNARIAAQTRKNEPPAPPRDITIHFWKRDTHKERADAQRKSQKGERGAE